MMLSEERSTNADQRPEIQDLRGPAQIERSLKNEPIANTTGVHHESIYEPRCWRSRRARICGAARRPGRGAETKMKLVLNWKYQGPQGMFFLAEDKGYFKAEGLDVTLDQGNGSGAAVPRLPTAPMTSASATSTR